MEPDNPPPQYEEIMAILGESASAKGPYQSRNSLAPGLLRAKKDKSNERDEDLDKLTPQSEFMKNDAAMLSLGNSAIEMQLCGPGAGGSEGGSLEKASDEFEGSDDEEVLEA
ncbi:hypothetical protein HDU98_005614, partial [Podochytrium sp. JEL0797]